MHIARTPIRAKRRPYARPLRLRWRTAPSGFHGSSCARLSCIHCQSSDPPPSRPLRANRCASLVRTGSSKWPICWASRGPGRGARRRSYEQGACERTRRQASERCITSHGILLHPSEFGPLREQFPRDDGSAAAYDYHRPLPTLDGRAQLLSGAVGSCKGGTARGLHQDALIFGEPHRRACSILVCARPRRHQACVRARRAHARGCREAPPQSRTCGHAGCQFR